MELESFSMHGKSALSDASFSLGFGVSTLIIKGDLMLDDTVSLPVNILISENSSLRIGESCVIEKAINVTNLGTMVADSDFLLAYLYNYNETFFNKAISISREFVNYGRVTVSEKLAISNNFKSYGGSFEGNGTITCYNCLDVELYGKASMNIQIGNASRKYPTSICGSVTIGSNWLIVHSELTGSFNFSKGSVAALKGVFFKNARLLNEGDIAFYGGSVADSVFQSNGTIKLFDSLTCDPKSLIQANNISFTNGSFNCNYAINGEATMIGAVEEGDITINGFLYSEDSKIEGSAKVNGTIDGNITICSKGKLHAENTAIRGTLISYGSINGKVTGDMLYLYNSSIESSSISVSEAHFWGGINIKDSSVLLKKARMYNGTITGASSAISFDECTVDSFEISASMHCKNCTININYDLTCTSMDEKIFEGCYIKMTEYSTFNMSHSSFIDTYTSTEGNVVLSKNLYMDNFTLNAVGQFVGADINCTSLHIKNKAYFTDTSIKSCHSGVVAVSNSQERSINGTFVLRNTVFRLSGRVSFSPSYTSFENSYIENKDSLHVYPASKQAYMNYAIKNYGNAIFEECNFQALYNYGVVKMNKNAVITKLHNELQCVLSSNLTVETLVLNSTGFISGKEWVIVTKAGCIEGEISCNFLIRNGRITFYGDTIAIYRFYALHSMISSNLETLTNIYDMLLTNVTLSRMKKLVNKGYLSLSMCKPDFSIKNENKLDLNSSDIQSLENGNLLTFLSDATVFSLTNNGVIDLNNFTVRISNKFASQKGFSSGGRFFIEKSAGLHLSDFLHVEVLLEGKLHLLSDCSMSKTHLGSGSSIDGGKKLSLDELKMSGSVEIDADLYVLNSLECKGSVGFQGNTLETAPSSVSTFLDHSTLSSVDVINNGNMSFHSTVMTESSFTNHGLAFLYNSTIRNFRNSNDAEFTEGPTSKVLNLVSDGKLYGNGACDVQGGSFLGIINVSVTLGGEVTCKNASFLKDVRLEGAYVHGSSSVHAPLTIHESEFVSGRMDYRLGEFSSWNLNCKDFTFDFATSTIFSTGSVESCDLNFHSGTEVSASNFHSSKIFSDGKTKFNLSSFDHTFIHVNGATSFASCRFVGYTINVGSSASNTTGSLGTPTVTANGLGKFASSTFIDTVVLNGNDDMELVSSSFSDSVVLASGSASIASNNFGSSIIHASGSVKLASNEFTSSTAYFNESTELVFNDFRNTTVCASGSAKFGLDSLDPHTTLMSNATQNASNSFNESVVWAVDSVKFVSCSFCKSEVFSNDETEFLFSTFENFCNVHLHNNTSMRKSCFLGSSVRSTESVKFTATTFNDSTINADDTTVFESSSFTRATIHGNGSAKFSGSFRYSKIYAVGSPEFTNCTFARSPILASGATKFTLSSFTEYEIYTNSSFADAQPTELDSTSAHINGQVEFGLCSLYKSVLHATDTAKLVSNSFEYSSLYANGTTDNTDSSFFRSRVYTTNTTDFASNSFESSFLYATGLTHLTYSSFSGSEVRSDNGVLELRSSSFTESVITNNAFMAVDEGSYFNYVTLSQSDGGYLLLKNVNMSGFFELDVRGTIEGGGFVTNEKIDSIHLNNALINGSTPGLLKTRNYLETSRINFGIYGLRKHTDFFVLESESIIAFSNIDVFFYYTPSVGDKFEIAFYSDFRSRDFSVNYFNIDPSAVTHIFYENNLTIQVIGCQNGSPNVTDCYLCDEGNFFDNGVCLPCPKGHYNNLSGSGVCLKCPKGYYSDVAGAVQCKKCDSGYTTDGIQCIKTGSQSSESDGSSSLSSSSERDSSSSSLVDSGSGSSSLSKSYSSDFSSSQSLFASESVGLSFSSTSQTVTSSESSIHSTEMDPSTHKYESSSSSSLLKESGSSESSSDEALLTYTSSEKKSPTINWFFPLSLLLGLGLFICLMMKRGKKEEKVKIFKLCKEAVDGLCETDTQPNIEHCIIRFMAGLQGNNVTLQTILILSIFH